LSARFFGGDGNDQINPQASADSSKIATTEAYGGGGNDTLLGGDQNDTLHGDKADGFTGNPIIGNVTFAAYDTANDGDDFIAGYGGDDSLFGDGGNDHLSGGPGSDSLDGGSGSDFLYGGPRGQGFLDILTGGTGPDSFMLSYSEEGTNQGASFWAQYFAKMPGDIAGNVAKVAISDAIKAAGEGLAVGFLAAALGPVGQDLAVAFVDLIESLIPSDTPVFSQDVMVITDFDPREDILVLPLQSDLLNGLSATVVTANQIPGLNGSSAVDVLQFSDASTVYAYVQLSTDFMDALGIPLSGVDMTALLNSFFTFSSGIAGTGNLVSFTNLQPDVMKLLPDGGFQPTLGTLAPGAGVKLIGAVGGLVASAYGVTPILTGTNYADGLTLNSKFVSADVITTDQVDGKAGTLYGFGGDDLLYGSLDPDLLSGGDGDDLIYSFGTGGANDETILGGAGNDTLVGGSSRGVYDGGDGTDTFAVLQVGGADFMQLEVDLTSNNPRGSPFAAEREMAPGGPAPVSATPPFIAWIDPPVGVNNVYTLINIENVIGGPLNDWIRAAAQSVIEGAAGADYIDASAGQVTLSYETSSAGVIVQILPGQANASGGDAEGDVIVYTTPDDVVGLVGSASSDTLGVYLAGLGQPAALAGNGGSDLFQILGTNGQTGFVSITGFSNTGDDPGQIDLRPLGITSASQVSISGQQATVTSASGTVLFIAQTDVAGALTTLDFLFSTAASGAAQARRGGDGLSGSENGDQLSGSSSQDFLMGNGGDDLILGRAGNDVLEGHAGDDVLLGALGDDRLSGGDGADTLAGHLGADWLSGDDGADVLRGGAGDDTLSGGDGEDILAAGDGDDLLQGGADADRLLGGQGRDTLQGGEGNDALRGGADADVLEGDAGADSLFGGEDADVLRGGAGSDRLRGEAGDDVLDGGAGADWLHGGAGADTFLLRVGEIGGDRVVDFDRAAGDRLQVLAALPVTVTSQGEGVFAISDGALTELVTVRGGLVADFLF
jgi:Ca2+-binding RTX toxin-like protein